MLVRHTFRRVPTSSEANGNSADHPHGGGRGKSKGNVNPVSPWGMPVSLTKIAFPMKVYLLDCRPKADTRLGRLGNQISGL
jgi:hypothetical protein